MSRAANGYLWGMQIEQDPGDYRVQATDGSWQQRVNKPLCRWLGVLTGGIALMASVAPGSTNVLVIAIMAFLSGGLITLSLKSLNW